MPRRRPHRSALHWLPVLAILAAFIAPSTSLAAPPPWNKGDVFVGIAGGAYQVYTSAGVLKETLQTGAGFTTGCALDSAGNLFGTNFSDSTVPKYDAVTHLPTLFGGGYSIPEDVAFDLAGRVYVSDVGGIGIRQFDATGNFLKSIVPTTRVDWFDIAADQDTILFTDESGTIHRASISSGLALSDFAPTGGNFGIRFLADGSVLVAAGNSGINKFNSAGTLIQSFHPVGGEWFALNLDPNGTSFWSAPAGLQTFQRFNIATGASELGPFNTGTGQVFGICVKGEITAATVTGITLAPMTATNPAGGTHTVTATVTTNTNAPVPGVTVTFTVQTGPNAGKTGTGVTDSSGNATFTYTDTGGAGTDTIVASFTDSAGIKHTSKSVTKIWTPGTVDKTPPACNMTAVITGPPKQLTVTVQDTGSGLQSVVVTENANVSVAIPSFAVGTTSPVIVTATKVDQSSGSSFALRVTDVAGNVTNCDPAMLDVGSEPGMHRVQTAHHVSKGESNVTIYNQTPGLTQLTLIVDGKRLQVDNLTDGEQRTVDASSLMRRGSNTVTIIAQGKSHGSAIVLLSD
jgi:hypothetical protein